MSTETVFSPIKKHRSKSRTKSSVGAKKSVNVNVKKGAGDQVVDDAIAKAKEVREGAEKKVAELHEEKKRVEQQLQELTSMRSEMTGEYNVPSSSDLALVRACTKPPPLVRRVMDVVLLHLYKPMYRYTPDWCLVDPFVEDRDKFAPLPSWEEALKFLGGLGIYSFHRHSKLNGELLELMEPIMRMPDYDEEGAKQAMGALAGLLTWTKKTAEIFAFDQNMGRVQSKLSRVEEQLAHAMGILNRTPKPPRKRKSKKVLVGRPMF